VKGDLTRDSDHEERLNEVLLAYVEALQAGREPDRCQLLAAHPDLRPDLEAFFASHDEVERLAAPLRQAAAGGSDSGRAPGTEAEDDPAAHVADIGQLGDFRLLREIGRGGMGVVYEAEQISLRRRVALKILPFAAAIDPRELQRFKNEALAAAHLRHENIVPVYAVGCERGVHYYAMQFVEGQSLAALIGELRRLSAEPDRPPPPHPYSSPPRGERGLKAAPLSAPGERGKGEGAAAHETQVEDAAGLTAASISRQRAAGGRKYSEWVARLGRQAALALEHAHQTGIVHRDVKPANLLLDARGQLWVTDFGLAQVTGDAGLTATGELLGTLRYASPEQALARRGVVDHRSDVYSLGATLYELLTLRPLFEGRDRNELLRQIADADPPLPRSLVPSVPAELETILLKALRKEPGERYATAQDLADDLGRFLDNRPILARRPTLADHLRKWARRHPSAVAAGALVLLLLSAGSLVSTALIRGEQARTRAEQQRTEEAYRRERQRAEEAEARFRLARRSVDELIQVSEEELADRPGMEGVRKRLLRSALGYYQEFVEQRQDDPAAQAELRDTTGRVRQILADLAVLRATSKLYLLCQPAVLDALGLDEHQREKVKELTTRAFRQWAESLNDIGRVPRAERRRGAIQRAWGYDADVGAILMPAQQARLRQIGWQSEGVGAFRDPEVVAELKLTAQQRARIRAIEERALFAWMRTARRNRSGGDRGPPPPPRDGPVYERTVAVLTEEQARRWREMTGEPVKGLTAPFSPAGPPFGPMRGPRGPAR
jgi:serine/threonine protein kinase